jgi:hypothetical protein
MVDKNRRKIAKKPQTQSLPDPDSWVSSGGVDPEIESVVSTVKEKTKKTEKKVEVPTSEKLENEKTYPHRISFDMENSQYKRLKWASFDSECPMNSILREAVEEWMKSRNY